MEKERLDQKSPLRSVDVETACEEQTQLPSYALRLASRAVCSTVRQRPTFSAPASDSHDLHHGRYRGTDRHCEVVRGQRMCALTDENARTRTKPTLHSARTTHREYRAQTAFRVRTLTSRAAIPPLSSRPSSTTNTAMEDATTPIRREPIVGGF
jgi:hypothetical protein